MSFLRNVRAGVNKAITKGRTFAAQLPQNLQRGHLFVNKTVLPALQKGHQVLRDTTAHLDSAGYLTDKSRKDVSNLHKFAQAGVDKLSDANSRLGDLGRKHFNFEPQGRPGLPSQVLT